MARCQVDSIRENRPQYSSAMGDPEPAARYATVPKSGLELESPSM